VLGETPGIPGVPAQGAGVAYRCGLCGFQRRYRESRITDQERARRNFELLRQATKR
jgi:hypothetical protein